MTKSDELNRLKDIYSQRKDRGRYSLFEVSHLRKVQEVEATILDSLGEIGWTQMDGKSVLDVGCGRGFWLRRSLDWGAKAEDLYGIDAIIQRIEIATKMLPDDVNLVHGDAAHLPWPADSFDLVSQFVVFSSILDPELRKAVAAEMLRVLKPDGCLIWYDFFRDNPKNSDVRGVKQSEIQNLFQGCSCDIRKITLAPPIARWMGKNTPWALSSFSKFSILKTHHFAIIRK